MGFKNIILVDRKKVFFFDLKLIFMTIKYIYVVYDDIMIN